MQQELRYKSKTFSLQEQKKRTIRLSHAYYYEQLSFVNASRLVFVSLCFRLNKLFVRNRFHFLNL